MRGREREPSVTFGGQSGTLSATEMSRAESLALELDLVKSQLEKLKAENTRLRAKDSTKDGLREEQESYEQVVEDLLLKDQEIADLNSKLEAVSYEWDTALFEVARVKDAAELELHRRLEQKRNKWEAREERLAKQLASVERQVGLSGALCDPVQLSEHFSRVVLMFHLFQ